MEICKVELVCRDRANAEALHQQNGFDGAKALELAQALPANTMLQGLSPSGNSQDVNTSPAKIQPADDSRATALAQACQRIQLGRISISLTTRGCQGDRDLQRCILWWVRTGAVALHHHILSSTEPWH